MPAIRSGATLCSHRPFAEVDETAEQPHHRALPRGTADAVDLGQRRLPQERFVDDGGTEQRQLLAHGQRVLADDPRHPLEPRLVVAEREEAAAQREPLAVALLGPPRREGGRAFRVGLERMDRRVEARLRAFHVERPERLDVTLGVARHRLGKVARKAG